MRPTLLVLALGAVLLAGCMTDRTDTISTPTGTSAPPTATPTASPMASDGTKCTSTKTEDAAVNPTLVFDTSLGTIKLTLFCDKAPVTTQNIVKLTEAGCYDGTKFHRVIAGFMDQGGDPLSKDDAKSSQWGTGGPSDCGQEPDTIVEEYYCKDGTISTDTAKAPTQCDAHGGLGLKHDSAGVFAMARTSAPHSSGSQFFIDAAAQPSLDAKYTVFGHTADAASTTVALSINRAPTDQGDRPLTPIVLKTATLVWS